MDRCSLPYESEWFASVKGHRYTDTGARTRTGVAYPMQVNGVLPFMDTDIQAQIHGHGQL